ncbi:alpha 1,2 mannosyltransferase [Microsporum canis]
MWRRTYLLLLLVRIYFALSPSYIHPDENFQGPELFAGRLFSYPSQLTWEFTSDTPIRSIFPLWLVYGLPMTLLKWLWAETGNGNPPPQLIYYVLRLTMFLLSLILEDWAIHELVPSPRKRRQTVVLVASCYVTWTYQTHTFSNSLETLLVLWSLVLIQRIVENKVCSLTPGYSKPWNTDPYRLTASVIVSIDTTFYTSPDTFSDFINNPVITPLNNLLYNSDSSNLANHGLHPRYQHFLVNLPLLLGPAYILSIWSVFTKGPTSPTFHMRNMRAYSALFGAVIISLFPHQEARFLMPCVPLLLTCFRPPKSRVFLAAWILFNCTLGAFMGIYHQGGVVPAQIHIPTLLADSLPPPETETGLNRTVTVLWWKTYSPPFWLVGDSYGSDISITTRDLKGIPRPEFLSEAIRSVPQCVADTNPFEFLHGVPKIKIDGGLTLLVAPRSNPFLDQFVVPDGGVDEDVDARRDIRLHKLWQYDRHINMDDFDPGDDGLAGAVAQVFGRYGLAIWLVTRPC